MRITIKLISIFWLLPFLSGCNNALYFYETEKISLTVEARPDSSQPVQGNLGLKQRIALVTPGISKDKGEALSSISSFRFKVVPESTDFFNGFNPVLIRTAFITGDASSGLTLREAEDAAIILSEGSSLSGNDFVYIRNLIDVLNKDTKQGVVDAKTIIAELNQLSELIRTDIYPVSTYKLAGTQKELTEKHKVNSDNNHEKNINGLVDYLGELHSSAKLIRTVLNSLDEYLVMGIPANTPVISSGLKATVTNTEEESKQIGAKLKKGNGYNRAVKYYNDNYLTQR